MDDAGGPGDRVRIMVSFNYETIVPFISNWWPIVPLTTWREGIVERFRTSRISGIGSQIIVVPTESPTPTNTNTPTDTNTPTHPHAHADTAHRYAYYYRYTHRYEHAHPDQHGHPDAYRHAYRHAYHHRHPDA